MIFGIIAALICIFLILKYVSRKLKWNSIDQLLKKIHIPFGLLIIAVIAIHCLVTFKVWSTRNVFIIITGFLATVFFLAMAIGYFYRKKLKTKWIVFHRSGALLLVFLILCHIVVYNIDFLSYKKNISEINIVGMNANNLKDGTYEGDYDTGYIYAKVAVKIHDGKIQDIAILKHENERGTPAEEIVNNIIDQQTSNVDAISGATNSSLVIKKAVENALIKGVN